MVIAYLLLTSKTSLILLIILQKFYLSYTSLNKKIKAVEWALPALPITMLRGWELNPPLSCCSLPVQRGVIPSSYTSHLSHVLQKLFHLFRDLLLQFSISSPALLLSSSLMDYCHESCKHAVISLILERKQNKSKRKKYRSKFNIPSRQFLLHICPCPSQQKFSKMSIG